MKILVKQLTFLILFNLTYALHIVMHYQVIIKDNKNSKNFKTSGK